MAAACQLASLIWPVLALSAFLFGLGCIALLTHTIGGHSSYTYVAEFGFATLAIVCLGVVVAVHARLRAAVRLMAWKEATVSGRALPKAWDFWLAAGLSAVASVLIGLATTRG